MAPSTPITGMGVVMISTPLIIPFSTPITSLVIIMGVVFSYSTPITIVHPLQCAGQVSSECTSVVTAYFFCRTVEFCLVHVYCFSAILILPNCVLHIFLLHILSAELLSFV